MYEEMSVREIRSQIAELEGALAGKSSDGLLVRDGDFDVADIPPHGATCTLNWCVPRDANWVYWYPSVEAAKARLLIVARKNGRIPREDGLFVDLTAPGCQSSDCYVTRLGKEANNG